MKLVQLTTVHPRNDIRIAIKETASLASRWPRRVELVVADDLGPATLGAHIPIHDLGRFGEGRLRRFFSGGRRALRYLAGQQPTVVHFHDPELLPVALVLKAKGAKIVYDVHENVGQQIQSKHYLPKIARWPIGHSFNVVEILASKAFDAVVAATPGIAKRFPPDKTVIVQNFPIIDELIRGNARPHHERDCVFAYVGGITETRGALEMVDAVDLVSVKAACLHLAGGMVPDGHAGLMGNLGSRRGWRKTKYHGRLDRSGVAQLLAGARAGLVVLHPTPNHLESYPIKMFEYMSAGLPVIASDFPLWRRIVEGAGCGLLVDPACTRQIAEAMTWCLVNPAEAEAMGARGRKAVLETYNWEREATKLVDLYERLTGDNGIA